MSGVAATAPDAPNAPDMGLASRIVNVVLSPGQAYAAVAARPRVLGVLSVVIVVMMAAQFTFLSTEVGQTAALNQQIAAMKAFGATVTDEMVQQLESRMAYAPITGSLSLLVFIPLFAAAVAGLLMAIFTVISGGGATYKQVFAVVSHSNVIGVLQLLFSLPIAYAREEAVSPSQLAVFFPNLDDTGFFYNLLSSIDLFHIWSVISLSIGMAVLYKRGTGGAAAVLFALYFVIVLIVAIVRTAV